MKKFVIQTEGCGLRLMPNYVNWLHEHGYPEADSRFANEDRTNEGLIACIEHFRECKQEEIRKAEELRETHLRLRREYDNAYVELSAQIDKLLDMLVYRPHQKARIIVALRKALHGEDWRNTTLNVGLKSNISSDAAKQQFMEVRKTFSQFEPQFKSVNDALDEFNSYCQDNSLGIIRGDVAVMDGFEIKSYDETKFTASLRYTYAESHYDADGEFMELKPFLTRDTVSKFVDAGDTDGLFAYLKSLNIGGFIDMSDHEPNEQNHITRNYDQMSFDEILASL